MRREVRRMLVFLGQRGVVLLGGVVVTTYFTCNMDVPEAIRRGFKDVSPTCSIPVDVSQLSPLHRELLASNTFIREDNLCIKQPRSDIHYPYELSVAEPTVDGIFEAIEKDIIIQKQEAAEIKQFVENTIATKKTRTITRTMRPSRNRDGIVVYDLRSTTRDSTTAEYVITLPDWGNKNEEFILKSFNEALEWTKSLEEENHVACEATKEICLQKLLKVEYCRRQEELRKEVELEAKKKADEEFKQEALTWVAAHGSKRLKRIIEEGFEFTAVYRDERLAMEKPNWKFSKQWGKDMLSNKVDRFEFLMPRNPPESALDLLESAREVDPNVELYYVQLYAKANSKLKSPGFYALISTFMGEEIVWS